MNWLTKLMGYVNRLALLKSHDEEMYEKLVNHCTILGIMSGSLGTLWILLIIFLLTR